VLVSDFDFELPPGLIADRPAEPRDAARLLVCEQATGQVRHGTFRDLPAFLRPADLLVLNDTRVRPWRLWGRRATGGRVECLILELRADRGVGFLRPAARLRIGEVLAMEDGALELVPVRELGGGRFEVELRAEGPVEAVLERCGRAPLPPYIARDGREDPGADREQYQTVFARAPGAVAAPTAGLHFTGALLAEIAAQGVETAWVTLHVGEGTFAPVRVERVEDHRMHAEAYELPAATSAAVARARQRGGRVIAVGTTSCRTLETCATGARLVCAGTGSSDLFLYPGREFQVVDGLITNFHLPRSTLLMLVAAFVGRERILTVYREAVARGYRFYSYGDAMLIV
jgi:S-adenosylmethionine:tRNA ribosyltransferase-isomerase